MWHLAPARGVALCMPRLGEAIEPARPPAVEPWWRGVKAVEKGCWFSAEEQAAEDAPLQEPID